MNEVGSANCRSLTTIRFSLLESYKFDRYPNLPSFPRISFMGPLNSPSKRREKTILSLLKGTGAKFTSAALRCAYARICLFVPRPPLSSVLLGAKKRQQQQQKNPPGSPGNGIKTAVRSPCSIRLQMVFLSVDLEARKLFKGSLRRNELRIARKEHRRLTTGVVAREKKVIRTACQASRVRRTKCKAK